jgi:hypothetical protein
VDCSPQEVHATTGPSYHCQHIHTQASWQKDPSTHKQFPFKKHEKPNNYISSVEETLLLSVSLCLSQETLNVHHCILQPKTKAEADTRRLSL